MQSDVHGFIQAVATVTIQENRFSDDRADLRGSSFRGSGRNISDSLLCRLEDEFLKNIWHHNRLVALPAGLRILRLQDNSAAVVRLTRPRPDDHPDYIEVSIMTCHFFTEYKWARIACLVGTAALLVGVTAVVVLNCPPLMALVTQLLEMPQQQVFGGLPDPIITQLEAFFAHHQTELPQEAPPGAPALGPTAVLQGPIAPGGPARGLFERTLHLVMAELHPIVPTALRLMWNIAANLMTFQVYQNQRWFFGWRSTGFGDRDDFSFVKGSKIQLILHQTVCHVIRTEPRIVRKTFSGEE